MSIFRIFPFISAFIGITAVVLSIVGISTSYWFSTDLQNHSGLWKTCVAGICIRTNGGRPAIMAIVALIAIIIASILSIFAGLTRNKSDANNNFVRLSGIITVILLFSSSVLISASLYTYMAAKNPIGYSFILMAIAQFLSFLATIFLVHWMGHSFTVNN